VKLKKDKDALKDSSLSISSNTSPALTSSTSSNQLISKAPEKGNSGKFSLNFNRSKSEKALAISNISNDDL
jgi:hypothetical protein